MSEEAALFHLEKLKRRYFFLRLLEIVLIAVATSLLTYSLSNILASHAVLKISMSLVAGLLVAVVRVRHYHLFNLSTEFFTRFLNSTYPELKESADLLTKQSTSLTTLQQLQKIQTLERFNDLYPEIKLPQNLFASIGIFAVCLSLYIALSGFTPNRELSIQENNPISNEIKPSNSDTTSVFIKSLTVSIRPPSYTSLATFEATGFDLTFPEGSLITWTADFSGAANDVKIHFSGRDSIELITQSATSFTVSKSISGSGFYQLEWKDQRKTHRSDYYSIEAIKDQPPKVSVTNLEQFTQLNFTDDPVVDVRSSLGDDYGLTKAHIIATVAKGSGESVKFREEKLEFVSPKNIIGKQVNASLTLNLKKLGLEPGDEIYFYVEAFDNKMPEPNRNRTETFFIALRDTATEISVADAGLGVDLLPEYFRSQRQIIIDTEKLLKEKKKITKKEFNSTSNELGYDQKVLRLRYGQFMGEEAESGIGLEALPSAEEHDEKDEDVLKRFGHQHDTENEHNLVDQKKEAGHSHSETKNANEKEDPLKAFTHSHDSEEEATFFVQSVRAKLKTALSVMWDAELYLRLYEPEKSLPFQYKALNLLKEISNDSRIYVHRTGFDPPPLKEEKRLTAELTEIKNFTNKIQTDNTEKYPAIRAGLMMIEKMLTENSTTASSDAQKKLTRTGQELATLAVEQPARYLKGLSELKSLTDQKVSASDMHAVLLEIRKTLYSALPQPAPSPTRHQTTVHSLDMKFIQHLDKGSNE